MMIDMNMIILNLMCVVTGDEFTFIHQLMLSRRDAAESLLISIIMIIIFIFLFPPIDPKKK